MLLQLYMGFLINSSKTTVSLEIEYVIHYLTKVRVTKMYIINDSSSIFFSYAIH